MPVFEKLSLTGRQKVLELSQHDDGKSSVNTVSERSAYGASGSAKVHMKTTPEWPANRSGDYVTVLMRWVFTNKGGTADIIVYSSLSELRLRKGLSFVR